MASFVRSKCLFCSNENTGSSTTCNVCEGLTLPKVTDDQQKLEWDFYAFGSKALGYHRSPKSSFHAAFESLDGGTRAAIFVGDAEEQLLLIQMPVEGDPGRMQKMFCIYATPSDSPKSVQIFDWTDGDQECKDLFFSSVNRILARDTMVSGQY
ncbi:ATP-dependent RNA helicase eIF4A [Fonsecaea nubica]|uniref:ATP-dependent RNA helicase eIF4A n=1 Tax=Fonsecaea nubica TaxID=856822 RepID=A0A178CWS7_9EURO|nr:ATP-dependent RNA helicase eIF4A [Fonsecaea nubica]OAL33896.1 ATP-dependent RNA helicase eIF4A [Fonsecaea nubica]